MPEAELHDLIIELRSQTMGLGTYRHKFDHLAESRAEDRARGGVAMQLFDLTGKVAVVTGGNGGIGLGMAQGMASFGAAIVIAGRNAAKAATAWPRCGTWRAGAVRGRRRDEEGRVRGAGRRYGSSGSAGWTSW